MTKTTGLRLRRTVAAAGAFALVTAGMLAASAAGAAVDDYGNVDTTRMGSLIIHKHEQQAAGSPTGSPDGSTSPTSPGVQDVEFTVYTVDGIDLGTPAGWDELSGLSANADCTVTGHTTTAVTTVTTDAAGLATAANLPVAAYLVCETAAPATVVDRATPFLVSVPHPYQDGWLYNVNVYPKNGISGIEKEVTTPTDFGLGATIEFPVRTLVPRIDPARDLTSFIVVDTLDARLNPVAVSQVTVDGVAVDPANYTVTVTGQTAEVVFTAAGLTWLEGQAGKQVTTVFTGVIAAVGDGHIVNSATTYVNDPTRGNGIVSNDVVTNWGDVRALKTDAATPATALQGAQFEVYAAVTPYPAAAGDCSAAEPTGAAISVNGSTVFTSDAQGVVSVAGLFISDTNTGEQGFRCYVLKETQAPAGYITPTGTAALTGVAVNTGTTATTTWDATVPNQQQAVPMLPLTGASGQVILTTAGIGLLALAVGLLLLRRRRQLQQV